MLSIAYLFAVLFLQTGGNDLLDYTTPDDYWHAKQVTVTAEQLSAELKPVENVDISKPLADLSSTDSATRYAASKDILAAGPGAIPQLRAAADAPDLDVAASAAALIDKIDEQHKPDTVRRLMAIRTLGEMKSRDSIPILTPLEKSKEPFVAEYAKAAIASINGEKPATRPAAAVDARRNDAWHLPAAVAAIIQATPAGENAMSLEKIFNQVQLPPEQRKEVLASLTTGVIAIADKIGNARLTSITLGFSGDIGLHGGGDGFAVMILRGSYDSRAAAAALREQNIPTQSVAGIDVFVSDGLAVLLPGDDKAVILLATSREKLPLAEVVAALNAKSGPLESDKDLAPLVKQTDISQSMWAVARMTDAFRQDPILAGFDTIRLVGRRRNDVMELSAAATGKNAGAVAGSIAELKSVIDEALNDVKAELPQMPALKPVVDFLDSVKCESNGVNATISARLPESIVTPAAAIIAGPEVPDVPTTQPDMQPADVPGK